MTDVPDPATDRRLVGAYLERRDEASFVALYRAHTRALYRMAWRAGGLSPEEVEEVVQEAWTRAVVRLPSFRFDAALRTWLIGILIRCTLERARRGSRAGTVGAVADEPSGHTTPDLSVDLERAIARLPDGMREVFLLHDVEGLTHEEIGKCLDVTAGTSKSQLFAARKRLQQWIGRSDHGT
jgi:RNA polymerase sigma-70 factor (ECF subfamily)